MKHDLDYMISVMQAAKEGKEIESTFWDDKSIWYDCKEPDWNWDVYDYRIKPEPKYVPYENAEEFLRAQKKHGLYVILGGVYKLASFVTDDSIMFSDLQTIDFDYLLDKFKWQDGTPCGKLKE